VVAVQVLDEGDDVQVEREDERLDLATSAELMTDPFANYLAQRLLEYATDEQRDALIESISGDDVQVEREDERLDLATSAQVVDHLLDGARAVHVHDL
jgi:hypothetical protein